MSFKMTYLGTSLVVQWLRLQAPNAGGLLGSIHGQGTRSHIPQLRVCMAQWPGAAKYTNIFLKDSRSHCEKSNKV